MTSWSASCLQVYSTCDINTAEGKQKVIFYLFFEEIGKTQFKAFETERLEKRAVSLFDPIKRNNLASFSSPHTSKAKSSEKLHLCRATALSLLACILPDKVMTVIWKRFSPHENQSFSPALTQFGQLRFITKSDLIQYLEKISPGRVEAPSIEALLLDDAAIMNMLKPGLSMTFQELTVMVFFFPT